MGDRSLKKHIHAHKSLYNKNNIPHLVRLRALTNLEIIRMFFQRQIIVSPHPEINKRKIDFPLLIKLFNIFLKE